MKKSLISIALIFSFASVFAQTQKGPYNENQDIRSDIRKAIVTAKAQHKQVLIQWGGNWCPWCIRFHNLVTGEHKIDSILKKDYVYMLANVPKDKSKRDMALFGEYGYPNRFGFPVFVVLDGTGKQLHIQDSGLLEYGKDPGYDTTKVLDFLRNWNVKAVDPGSYKN